MLQYGPETGETRDLLRRYTALRIDVTWPEENAADGARLDEATTLAMLESIQGKLLGLAPQGEAQRWLQARALQIGGDLVEERWLLAAQNEGSVPRPFLAVLVFWLTILRCLRPVCPTSCHCCGGAARLRPFPVCRDFPDPGDGSTL